jgi:hypothetical protein
LPPKQAAESLTNLKASLLLGAYLLGCESTLSTSQLKPSKRPSPFCAHELWMYHWRLRRVFSCSFSETWGGGEILYYSWWMLNMKRNEQDCCMRRSAFKNLKSGVSLGISQLRSRLFAAFAPAPARAGRESPAAGRINLSTEDSAALRFPLEILRRPLPLNYKFLPNLLSPRLIWLRPSIQCPAIC